VTLLFWINLSLATFAFERFFGRADEEGDEVEEDSE